MFLQLHFDHDLYRFFPKNNWSSSIYQVLYKDVDYHSPLQNSQIKLVPIQAETLFKNLLFLEIHLSFSQSIKLYSEYNLRFYCYLVETFPGTSKRLRQKPNEQNTMHRLAQNKGTYLGVGGTVGSGFLEIDKGYPQCSV